MQLPETLPAGSTIILSTTSPDKRAEYEVMFQRFDLNFIFLEDLGLSPQKTDEMTNSYDGNLLQKAAEVSLSLHTNLEAIKDRLGKVGFDISKPIMGMVEDSGIEIYPINKDRKIRAAFRKEFRKRIDERIYDEFLTNKELKAEVFPKMSNDEVLDFLSNVEINNLWMTKLKGAKNFPGPNYKPIYEVLPGGVREFYDIMHASMETVSKDFELDSRSYGSRSLLRFRNHCSMMLVAPHESPLDYVTAEDIIEGESKGRIASQDEIDSLIRYRLDSPKPKHRLGRLFTSDFIIPDKQINHTDYTQRQLIEKHNLLQSDGQQVSPYYRLHAIKALQKKYGIPYAVASDNGKWKYKARIQHTNPPEILVLYSGQNKPALVNSFEEKLRKEGFVTVERSTPKQLLSNQESRILGKADIVFLLPSNGTTELQNTQLILGATVDKQVMPSAKEKTLVILNPKNKKDEGPFDGALKILRHKKYTGLKNGISEVNHVLEYNPSEYKGEAGVKKLFEAVKPLLEKESARKSHRLTGVERIQPKIHIAPPQIPSLEVIERFTVFVAGGAANEYPGFKAPANQVGRFIHDQDWVLVTGAGQKEGPMGAVHSGYVEAFLTQRFKKGSGEKSLRRKALETIRKMVKKLAVQNTTDRRLTGEDADSHQKAIMKAMFKVPNVEFLVHEAPEVLARILNPREGGEIKEFIESLKEAGAMVGYSMPPLLISEGSGKWPIGMQGYNAGNMQRRMHEMLRSAAHVFLAGGQGTDQELVESALLAIEQHKARLGKGLKPRPIYILDQEAYKNGVYEEEGTVFLPALEVIDRELKSQNLTRKDIGLKIHDNMRSMEADLKAYVNKHWQGKKEAKF